MDIEYVIRLAFFLAGTFVGHCLNLWRDRRKDFNEVAARLRPHIRNHARSGSLTLPDDDIEMFRATAGPKRRLQFALAMRRYRHACRQYAGGPIDPVTGDQPRPGRPEKIDPTIKGLLAALASK